MCPSFQTFFPRAIIIFSPLGLLNIAKATRFSPDIPKGGSREKLSFVGGMLFFRQELHKRHKVSQFKRGHSAYGERTLL